MSLKFYNYLSRVQEEFEPIGKTVGLYTCGPTVYDFVHIGNWRTFIFEDILKRVLIFNGYKVKHVMNITDIDDKIINKSRDLKIDFHQLTTQYEKVFFTDLEKLNIINADVYPRATEHITTMIQIIVVLLAKKIAYKSQDGIYFAVDKFKNYGKLSGLSRQNLKKGARIAADQYDKENWSDFALWKFSSTRSAQVGQIRKEPTWDAPFGRGRPGWHIECSAMSMKYLGESFDPSGKLRVSGEHSRTIDMHCGGVDLLFPHHENEIAQSEASTGRKFVQIWLEGEHLLVYGQKMAKSLGNIYTLAAVIDKGFEPLALRYLFLTAHYRSKLNFTWQSLEAAQSALDNLRGEVSSWDKPNIGCAGFEGDFKKATSSDLDMPKALSIMWDLVKSTYPTSAKHQSILVMDEVLGLNLAKLEKQQLPLDAKKLIDKREELRKAGKFRESDEIRKELKSMGIDVEDTPEGPRWKIKKPQPKR